MAAQCIYKNTQCVNQFETKINLQRQTELLTENYPQLTKHKLCDHA